MPTITDIIRQSENFNTLASALEITGLDEELTGGNYTLFAPTDAAFAKLPPGVIDGLKSDMERFRTLLMHHVVEGAYTSEDLAQMTDIRTLHGETVGMHPSQDLDIGIASFMETDIEADNGMIHSIDTVLLPEVEATVEW